MAKIIPVPKGQERATRGKAVRLPPDVQQTADALPRPGSESQLLKRKLKRRLRYEGQRLFPTVTRSELVQVLHNLTQIHPRHEDITIGEEVESRDAKTSIGRRNDNDRDKTVEEEDYDEGDLIESRNV